MKPDRVWELCEFYEHTLAKRGHKSREFDANEYDSKNPPADAILAHCAWMMRRCAAFRTEYESNVALLKRLLRTYADDQVFEKIAEAREPLDKAMRWMCYVQGMLHALDVFSCTELRDQARHGVIGSIVKPLFRGLPVAPPLPIHELSESEFDAAIAEGRFNPPK